MSDFLVSYLDAIDERLLDYLDSERELSLDTVHRMRRYATALLESTISVGALVQEWADWFTLVAAFVAAYGSDELAVLEERAAFLGRIEEEADVVLMDADCAYVRELELQLDVYPESRG